MKALEVSKSDEDRKASGFYDKYLSGQGLDIGYRGFGAQHGMEPVLPNAIGIDLDTPNYDGIHLQIPGNTQDFVFSSHCLEHIADYVKVLQEWHRLLKVGGHMIIIVPHGYLYERSLYSPAAWGSCHDHKRVYTPARLLREIEESLRPNSYRIVSLRDNDKGFHYDAIQPNRPPDIYHACFEIELVLRKIKAPEWKMD